MKNTLLMPLGQTPQILTEALYLLNQDGIVIDSVVVVSTEAGVQALQACHSVFDQLHQQLTVVPVYEHVVLKVNWQWHLYSHLSESFIKQIYSLQNRFDGIYLCLTGGYKALTFQLGYAFTMLAREQDCLFSVAFDQVLPNDFYFPQTQHQQEWIKLQYIDFVPLRPFLPETDTNDYQELVTSAKQAFRVERVAFSVTGKVQVNDHCLSFQPSDYAFYYWLYEQADQGNKGVALQDDWETNYLDCYQRLYDQNAYYQRIKNHLISSCGDTGTFFSERKARVNRVIKQALGKPMVDKIGIVKARYNDRNIFKLGWFFDDN